ATHPARVTHPLQDAFGRNRQPRQLLDESGEDGVGRPRAVAQGGGAGGGGVRVEKPITAEIWTEFPWKVDRPPNSWKYLRARLTPRSGRFTIPAAPSAWIR